jgi:hypothetical protein
VTEVATRPESELGTIERVIAAGDLSRLSPDERSRYYVETCNSLHLNPLTQPFQYITLNSRLTLYATRAATDQLRALHHVSIQIVSSEVIGDLYVVRARATLPDGRTDEEIGAVAIKGLQGEALANAWMKANTKAKRRVTLAIVGLGWLDESELDGVADARPFRQTEPPPAAIGSPGEEEAEPLPVLPEGVPSDDVDSLTGEALADACDRLRRRLSAANLPYPAYPTPRTNRSLREWWWSAAALLEPSAAG